MENCSNPSQGHVSSRRSGRVLVSIPLLISGKKRDGLPFDGTGQATVVNKQGAKIATSLPLEVGTQIRVVILSPYRSQVGRVVWADDQKMEFGIELERAENFWGIYFPPEDWREEASSVRLIDASELIDEPLPAREVVSLPRMASQVLKPVSVVKPQSVATKIEVPANGMEVTVSGMSFIRMPFQEKSILLPINEDEGTILLRPVISAGTSVRVVFLQANCAVRAKTVRNSTHPVEGRWRVWLKFSAPCKLLPPAERSTK